MKKKLFLLALVSISVVALTAQEKPALSEDEAKALFDSSCKLQTEGKHDEANAGFLRVHGRDPSSRIGLLSAYNLACGYSLTGNKTEALDWLEKAVAAGYRDIDHTRQDTDLDNIRAEERYLRCLEEMEKNRVVFSGREKVVVKFCDPSDATGVPYVKINLGEGTGAFLLDTGISGPFGNVVSPQLAPQCKLNGGIGAVKAADGEGNAMEARDLAFASIKFGGADGVLGFGFFGVVKTTIDYPAKLVEFERYPGGKETPTAEGAIVIPFQFRPVKAGKGQLAKCPFIEGTINGKPAVLIFDTGTNWSIVSPKAAKALGLEVKKEKVFSKMYDVAHLDLEVGGLKVKDTVFVHMPHPTLESVSGLTGTNIAGILGNDILKAYRVTLDYRNMRMILVKSAPDAKPKEF